MYLRVDWRLTTTDLPQALRRWPEWTRRARFRFKAVRAKAIGCERSTCFRTTPWLSKRSVGEAPVFASAALARSPLLVCRTQQLDSTGNQGGEAPRYIYVDRLEPTQFVGLLVHYLIEVRNPLDQIVASGQLSTRRWRLDPPPMPVDARACLKVGLSAPELSQALRIDVVLPSGEEALEPVVWYQSRPLDACGLFGTDDDMALEEGLRQADLNFEEDADLQNPRDWEGHPVARYLRGAYDKYGLKPIDSGFSTLRGTDLLNRMMEEGDAPSDAEKTRILEGEFIRLVFQDRSALDELCPENVAGARFMSRSGVTQSHRFCATICALRACCDPPNITSRSPAGHRSASFRSKPSRRPHPDVHSYQPPISRSIASTAAKVDPDVNQLAWRSQNTGAGGQTSGIESGEPFEVRVRFPGRSGSAAPRPGGFRIWVRDVLGTQSRHSNLPAPSRPYPQWCTDTVHTPWIHPEAWPLSTHHARASSWRAPSYRNLMARIPNWRKLFAAFSQALRLLPGAPRLVRAVAEVEQAQNGNHGQGEVGLNPSSEVQQAISRTLLTQHSLKNSIRQYPQRAGKQRFGTTAIDQECRRQRTPKGRGSTARVANSDADSVGAPCAIRRLGIRARIRARRDIAAGVRDASDLGAAISGPINDVENVIQASKNSGERPAWMFCIGAGAAGNEVNRCIRGGSKNIGDRPRLCGAAARRSWIWR